jgi:hypothetical protein
MKENLTSVSDINKPDVGKKFPNISKIDDNSETYFHIKYDFTEHYILIKTQLQAI